MITIQRSLRHMAWANARVFDSVTELPWSALGSYVVDPEWTAGRILYHLVESSCWYVHCLGIAQWRPIDVPQDMAAMRTLSGELAAFDAQMLSVAGKDDVLLSFEVDDGMRRAMRSTLLAQAVHHASEHRAQLMDALAARGHVPLSLDDIDLWAFERAEG